MASSSVRRRLHAVVSQVGAAAAVEAAPEHADDHHRASDTAATARDAEVLQLGLSDARGTGLYAAPRLLTNTQMAEFLAQGYLSLPVDDVVSRQTAGPPPRFEFAQKLNLYRN